MGIRKLQSGAYQIRKQKNNKSYSITVGYKPGKKEAEKLINEYIASVSDVTDSDTFIDYARRYISTKENILSPSTIKLYKQMLNVIPEDFARLQLKNITQADIQSAVNVYSVGHSPKSVRNFHGYISSIMQMYRPNFRWKITLPQKIETDYYIPTSDDVRKVLDLAKGSKYEIVLRLGAYGLRRSEAISITSDDLEGNTLHINKAKVISDTNEYVEKTTKTTFSTRDIYIDDDLADLIRKHGKAYTMFPNSIIRYLHKFQDQAGVPHFRYHDLRHYFATELCGSISDTDLCYLGGWSKTGYVLKKVYTHARAKKDEEIRKEASQILQKKLAQKLDGNS